MVHGFSYANYLEELGEDAQKEIFEKSSLDKAMKDAAHKTKAFLMRGMELTEDEAYSLMSVTTDFGVTQVVDGNWGVHAIIDKSCLEKLNEIWHHYAAALNNLAPRSNGSQNRKGYPSCIMAIHYQRNLEKRRLHSMEKPLD